MTALQRAAQHEAAHAVVARCFGIPVTAVWVRSDGAGRTEVDLSGSSPSADAAAMVAGRVWDREFSPLPFLDLACSDLRRFERRHGLERLYPAERAARRALERHRDAVLALAARLERERSIAFAEV